ncbi:hypothetical protein Hanom_Chr16g01484041 [Helianthus anomalus]
MDIRSGRRNPQSNCNVQQDAFIILKLKLKSMCFIAICKNIVNTEPNIWISAIHCLFKGSVNIFLGCMLRFMRLLMFMRSRYS